MWYVSRARAYAYRDTYLLFIRIFQATDQVIQK